MRSLTRSPFDQADFSLILFQVMVVTLPIPRFLQHRMADFNHLSEAEAIRELAQHTEAVKLNFRSLLFLTINIIR
jgi:hypothetical protein